MFIHIIIIIITSGSSSTSNRISISTLPTYRYYLLHMIEDIDRHIDTYRRLVKMKTDRNRINK